MPHFRAHQCVPPFPALQRVSPLMCHVSKLTNGLLPHPPLLSVSPCLQRATFLSSPTRSSLFLPSSESSLATCHIPVLTNPLLPPPPPLPRPCLCSFPPFPPPPPLSPLLPPPIQCVLFSMSPLSELPHPPPPPPSPPASDSSLSSSPFSNPPTCFSLFLPSSW